MPTRTAYKSPSLTLSLLFLLAGLFLSQGCTPTSSRPPGQVDTAKPETDTPPTTYRRGAHYFADAWPINFWSASHRGADADFAAVRKEGFDTIILVIPWSEFQPGIDPIRFNQRSLKRLARLIEIAGRHDLSVALRLGYEWDYHQDAQLPRRERFNRLFADQTVRAAWFRYLEKIAETVEPYDNVVFGFLTWEDYWGTGGGALPLPEKERLLISQGNGYPAWLKGKYTLAQVGQKYGREFASWRDVPVPTPDSPAVPWYLDYYDDLLVQKLYLPSREYFPKLSFEVRVDGDPVLDEQKKSTYYSHKKTYDLSGGMFTTAYYNAAFGAENKGDIANAEDTLKRFRYLFGLLREGTQNRIFLDQFNFVDNTPGFNKNTRLDPAQVKPFLEGATDILREYTNGYALWAYHDYAANELHNPAFTLGTEGWRLTGGAMIRSARQHSDGETENVLQLHTSRAAAEQSIPAFQQYYRGASDEVMVSLLAEPEGNTPSRVRIILGTDRQDSKVVTLDQRGRVAVTFPANNTPRDDLRIELVSGKATVREARVYHFVQSGGVYHLDGTPYPAQKEIVALNKRLQRLSADSNTAVP